MSGTIHPHIWQPASLLQLAHVRAGLTTRGFGNMAPYVGDVEEATQNRVQLAGILGCSAEAVVWATQVHGTDIAEADRRSTGCLGTFDAIVTREPGCLLLCYTADCVPIWLVSSRRPLGAVVHAGWRGSAALVVRAAVEQLIKLGAEPTELHAVVGPAIQGSCYEVGRETAERFPEAVVDADGGGYRVDLPLFNRMQLQEAGIPKRHIETSRLCTHCHQGFSSYRREKEAAQRMAAFLLFGS